MPPARPPNLEAIGAGRGGSPPADTKPPPRPVAEEGLAAASGGVAGGRRVAQAKRDALLARIAAGVILALLILLSVRTCERDKALDQRDTAITQRDTAIAERAAEAASHRQTKTDFRAAQAEAARQQQEALARIRGEQSRINEEVSRGHKARIADLNRRIAALGLRREPEPRAVASGASGEVRVPPTSPAPGGADAAAGDRGLSARERIIATEQALRLLSLQDWVRRQTAVPQ